MNKKAFTLIEILVAVLIIGILAAIAVPQYENVVKKSRIIEGMHALQKIHEAQHLQVLSTNQWTNNISSLAVDIPTESILATESAWVNRPTDDGKWYYYCYSMASCIAHVGDPDLPDFQIQVLWDKNTGPKTMQCYFAGKTYKARKFCRTQLKCISSNWETLSNCRLP